MYFRTLRTPLARLPDPDRALLTVFAKPFHTTASRYTSSYRRNRSQLNVPPDSSFIPSSNLLQDHIVFNPPSSAPSVLHTPPKFLPKTDPRRSLFKTTTANLTISPSQKGKKKYLPPAVANTLTDFPRHHLRAEDLAEIRRLHEQDPDNWTRRKLAKKFGCSVSFVRLVAPADKEKQELHYKKLEVVKSRWGPIRTQAREDRKKRKEMAKSDEYVLGNAL